MCAGRGRFAALVPARSRPDRHCLTSSSLHTWPGDARAHGSHRRHHHTIRSHRLGSGPADVLAGRFRRHARQVVDPGNLCADQTGRSPVAALQLHRVRPARNRGVGWAGGTDRLGRLRQAGQGPPGSPGHRAGTHHGCVHGLLPCAGTRRCTPGRHSQPAALLAGRRGEIPDQRPPAFRAARGFRAAARPRRRGRTRTRRKKLRSGSAGRAVGGGHPPGCRVCGDLQPAGRRTIQTDRHVHGEDADRPRHRAGRGTRRPAPARRAGPGRARARRVARHVGGTIPRRVPAGRGVPGTCRSTGRPRRPRPRGCWNSWRRQKAGNPGGHARRWAAAVSPTSRACPPRTAGPPPPAPG